VTTTTVKERPILFSGPMVRAILEGRKTQTRRAMKPQPIENGIKYDAEALEIICHDDDFAPSEYLWTGEPRVQWPIFCPYGQPGNRLWVRETFWKDQSGGVWGYRADGIDWPPSNYFGKGMPSIFMPRWASRITLEVTGVRVQRVQEISEEDAEAEGIFNESGQHLWNCDYQNFHPDQPCKCGQRSPQEEYGKLWDSINAKRGFGWDKNPWVWVVDFRRLA
jgi:hypothetical protein